jgi:transcriptional regulator with XRE-family HTH domain
MPESRAARGARRANRLLQEAAAEVRQARISAGLRLTDVGRATGLSTSELSRIERGQAPWVDVMTLSMVASVLGLDLWVRVFPGPDPLRDRKHAALFTAVRSRVGGNALVRAEVVLGDGRDLRAWDMLVVCGGHERCAIELDTRLIDAQAHLRRVALKRRDGDIDRLLLVFLDTRQNRLAVHAAAGQFEAGYKIDDAEAWEALAAGRLPPRDAILFVRVPRTVAGKR